MHMHACELLNCVKEESVLGFLDQAVDTNDHCVVPLIRLKSDQLLRFQLLCLHLLDIACKHLLWFRCGVDTVCLCVCVFVCASTKEARLDGVDSHYNLCIKGPPRVTVVLLVI